LSAWQAESSTDISSVCAKNQQKDSGQAKTARNRQLPGFDASISAAKNRLPTTDF
jgi:hypothetical protein